MLTKEFFLDRYNHSCETEANLLELIAHRKADAGQIRMWVSGLWTVNEMFAFKALWIDQDYPTAKHHFYVCGLLYEAMAKLSTTRTQENSIFMAYNNRLAYALVSDNADLIGRLASHRGTAYEHHIKAGSLVVATQFALQDNWDALTEMMTIYNHQIEKRREKWRTNDRNFFTGLLNRDTGLVEQALKALLQPRTHKQRNIDALAQNIVSHPAFGYAKLAWLKGLPLSVDSPLVPQALLPVQPLAEYTNPYPFLNELVANLCMK